MSAQFCPLMMRHVGDAYHTPYMALGRETSDIMAIIRLPFSTPKAAEVVSPNGRNLNPPAKGGLCRAKRGHIVRAINNNE